VGIDRDRHVAQKNVLYTFEAVPAGVRFQFALTVENATNEELGVVFMALNALERGDVRLGGNTSRGLGAVKLIELKTEIVDGDSLVEYLISGNRRPLSKAEREDYFNIFLGKLGALSEGSDVQTDTE